MARWIDALARTRNQFTGSLRKVFQRKPADGEVSLEELEETLLAADVPVRLAAELIEEIEDTAQDPASRRHVLRETLLRSLGPTGTFDWVQEERPLTLLIVGVNGSGKTTTAAKLARRVKYKGLTPLLGAADTFRAAGSDQLKIWADRLSCDVVGGSSGGDAASVAYDALDSALAKKADVVIIDTAGRMHTKAPLLQELQKIQRALSKRMEQAPHEIWIVLDASLGQNALLQAKTFHETTTLTGVIISKLDGSSKAGFLFAVARELGVPIRYVGLGEGEDDLVPFDAAAFVDALLSVEEEAPA